MRAITVTEYWLQTIQLAHKDKCTNLEGAFHLVSYVGYTPRYIQEPTDIFCVVVLVHL